MPARVFLFFGFVFSLLVLVSPASAADGGGGDTAAPAVSDTTGEEEDEAAPDGPGKPEDMRHGNIEVLFTDYWNDSSDSGSTLNLRLAGELMPFERQQLRWSHSATVTHNDCETLWVQFYTGGAACCYGDYLITECQGRGYATRVSPGRAAMESAPDSAKNNAVFSIYDTSFVAYMPKPVEGYPEGAAELSFSMGHSPYMPRLMLFEDNAWRLDNIGEFPAYHAAKKSEAQHYFDEETSQGDADGIASAAIRLVYSTIMAGDGTAAARTLLEETLPEQYRPLSETIFADIIAATRDTRPQDLIQPIDLYNLPRHTVIMHTVQPGETMLSLQRQYGADIDNIRFLNPDITDANQIRAGQAIMVPVPKK